MKWISILIALIILQGSFEPCQDRINVKPGVAMLTLTKSQFSSPSKQDLCSPFCCCGCCCCRTVIVPVNYGLQISELSLFNVKGYTAIHYIITRTSHFWHPPKLIA
ncbi:DUF6660 family protein [Mucilaginibacter sp. P4]|uniref:DUF6660 family protein n=1 Tax=Mucilaginibacter TaxID=423349 RepID=UPI00389AF0FD